ncbi:T9SS type A sorting domain-containing protein [Crocinitomix algicola]|uniref:T9SS type A sorting domain-containing protein n=1 Tax=Crocinitomix algicola TaxID=1740263 RepID=UPI000872F928|nr:T9SS type A sorting domain-containing protein [Crocinitomix algicola]
MKKYYKAFLIFLSIGFSVNTIAQETTFEFTGEPETFVVPAGISSITITASGAQGGADGGLGATMEGTFSVTPGETLHVIVGEEGHLQVGGNDQNSAGGGGGSFVYNADMELLIAAGGGGGRCPYEFAVPLHAECGGQVGESGGQNSDGSSFGGTSGNGGEPGIWSGTVCAGGGTGWETIGGGGIHGGINHPDWTGGDPYCDGGGGGCGGIGGFGGGGGAGNLYGGGGGGGGYSGGAGGNDPDHGGGGGSFNAGTDQVNIGSDNSGNGVVVIEIFCYSLTLEDYVSEICFGEEIVFEASSETGGTITWSDGIENGVSFTPDAVGTIVYTATSSSEADCDATVEITVIESPTVDSYVSTDEIIGGDGEIDITVSGGAPGYLYDWDNDGTGDFDDSEDLTGLDGGLYTVVVQDENGCEVSSEIEVNSQLSINDIPTAQVLVFPNPTTSVVQIQFNGQFDYQVLTVEGKILLTGNGFNNIDVDLEDFSSGTYLLELKSNNQLYQSKIIKE